MHICIIYSHNKNQIQYGNDSRISFNVNPPPTTKTRIYIYVYMYIYYIYICIYMYLSFSLDISHFIFRSSFYGTLASNSWLSPKEVDDLVGGDGSESQTRWDVCMKKLISRVSWPRCNKCLPRWARFLKVTSIHKIHTGHTSVIGVTQSWLNDSSKNWAVFSRASAETTTGLFL